LAPEADKAFVCRTLAMRDRTANQLQMWAEAFKQLQQSLPHVSHKIERVIPRGRHYVTKAKEISTFGSHTFSPSYALTFIRESEQDLHRETIDRLVSHFNETYLLKMDVWDLVEQLNSGFNAQAFTTLLLSRTDGLSPYDIGAENIRREFARTFQNASFRCKGKNLIIGNATYVDTSFPKERPRLRWDICNVPALCRALTLFEHASTVNHQLWDAQFKLWQNHLDVKNPYLVEEHQRIENLRFYRNGRIDIAFTSECAAKAFMQEFPVLENDF